MVKPPLVLIVVDGLGFSSQKIGNAVFAAKKPNLDFFEKNYPHTLLQASGNAVGLEWGEAGNSEVGHLSLGSGRSFRHYLPTINRSIADKSFFSNKVLQEAIAHTQKNNSKLHILGLLTSGSVHSSFKHLSALLDLVKKSGISKIYLHLFTDGKDSGTHESANLLSEILKDTEGFENIKVATIMGRDMAMNRNNDWLQTREAYELVVYGTGNKSKNILESLKKYHQENITDESIPPTVSEELTSPLVSENDSLIFFNFREDSIRQLARAFVEKDFSFFPREEIANLFVAAFTKYLDNPNLHYVFELLQMKNNLAEWLSVNDKKQLHIAESEKYAHVTIFFNGLENKVYDGETDLFLESPRNLEDFPEMRSLDIANKVVEEMKRNHYDFFLVNFANADMLSHLGNTDLVVKGVEKVDEAVGLIFEEVKKQKGTLIVTSDHGNAESLVYTFSGEKETKHNTNPVPFYLVAEEFKGRFLPVQEVSGVLPDVAPTILEIMDLPVPPEMDGKSLLQNLVTH
ncbi:MAG: 2,3-bisphosphoglycerate-independent phosphoglycerate mutase [Candidatus Yanofskybacteria bacterium]|nr:2,3-bisphosphoglycerate-independent phosphoglycerate mutase [Candidatus Yanofskybacteria bacterium]